jgi:hypothetical protein
MKTMTKEYKVSTVGEDDFPELEGKTVMYVPVSDNLPAVPCVVVGCNRSVGVTLVHADNPKKYIVCYRGPVCPGAYTETDRDMAEHNELFEALLSGIQDGEVYAEVLLEIVHSYGTHAGHNAGSHSCAYNQ